MQLRGDNSSADWAEQNRRQESDAWHSEAAEETNYTAAPFAEHWLAAQLPPPPLMKGPGPPHSRYDHHTSHHTSNGKSPDKTNGEASSYACHRAA
jgi:hypothetical protein